MMIPHSPPVADVRSPMMSNVRFRASADACASLSCILPALIAVALCSHPAGAQYLSLGAGPTAAFGGLGGDRPTGVAVTLSVEQERFERGRAWRGELFLGGFKAPREIEDVTGPIRNIA